MNSNSSYGVAETDDLRAFLDTLDSIPEPGECEPLDNWLASKHITHDAIRRVGARWQPPFTIAWVGPKYIKHRNLATDAKYTHFEFNDFSTIRVVKQSAKATDAVVIAEGESETAWFTSHYDVDVACMPSGSLSFKQSHADAIRNYKQVLVALDNDRAGNEGAERIMEMIPHAQRFLPEGNAKDFCEADTVQPLPPLAERPHSFVKAAEFLAMAMPDIKSYLANSVVPVGGQVMIHGPAKSFKSYLALDMLAQLSQGRGWLSFDFTGNSPLKVGVVQYEIPPAYFQDRVRDLFENAYDQDLFAENFLTFTPVVKPQLRAGNADQLRHLLGEIEYSGVQVLLIDPVRQALSGADLNSEKDVSLLRELVEPVKAMGVTVVLTHHDNKAAVTSKAGNPLGMTGSGAFSGDPDTIVSLTLPPGVANEDMSTCRHRDCYFMLRNAPAPEPRSFEFVPADEDRASHFSYSTERTEVESGVILPPEVADNLPDI